jgi:tetratricopeptide (TPR) repeat protein
LWLALLISVLALARGATMLNAQRAATPRTPAAPVPPAPAPSGVEVDLAGPLPQPYRAQIPASKPAKVVVKNRVPTVAYSLVVHGEGIPSGPRPFPPALFTSLRFLPSNGQCDRATAALDALRAVTEESQVPAALAALRAALAEGRCTAPQTLRAVEEATTLVYQTIAEVGQRQFLEVRRPDKADRMWSLELVVASAAPTWPRPTETAWIAASIVTDVAEMAAVAGKRPLPSPESIRVTAADGERVTLIADGADTITVDPAVSVWSTSPYLAAARRLLTRAGVRPGRRSQAASPLAETLLEPTPAVLMREDRRLSAALTADAASASNHEQAALLLAAFALRERAGWLSDVRPTLSRATAHLVLGEALRGSDPPSVEAQIATAAVSALAGRQVEALAAARRLPRSHRALEAWARALELRITGDWRTAPALAGQPSLVRFEAFDALVWRKTVPSALDAIEGLETDAVDWARIATGAGAVEVAHRFGPAALTGSLAEANEVHRALRGKELAPDTLASALNVAPPGAVTRSGPSPTITVLGWGQWGPFLQRHLLSALDKEHRLLIDTLGLPAEAAAFVEQGDALLRGLELHPLVVYRRNTRALGRRFPGGGRPDLTTDAPACAAIAALAARRPEAIPFVAWDEALRRCPERQTGALPPADAWFRPLLPFGTTLEAVTRMSSESGISYGLERIDALHALAPYDAYAARFYVLRRFAGQASAEEYRTALGPLVEYDVDALKSWMAAVPRNTAVGTEVGERLCAIAPDECFSLGEIFALEGRPDDAVRAYEKAIAGTRDRVAVSNNVAWIVDHLWDTSRKDRAMEIARQAGEAHSTSGLFTLARILERAGKLPDAEAALKAIAERYEDPSYLDSFYIRRHLRFHDAAYARAGQEALARRFPRGLEKATAADFHAPPAPREGVPETTVSNRLAKLGVLAGDVVVAVDGYRIRDNPQWIAVSSLTDAQQTTLTVWRGGGYADIKGPYLRLKFGP